VLTVEPSERGCGGLAIAPLGRDHRVEARRVVGEDLDRSAELTCASEQLVAPSNSK
jgi:hypothetical protein